MEDYGNQEQNPRILEDGRAEYTAPGEFDAHAAPAVRAALAETMLRADVQEIVIDLSDTSFLDSAGIATLIDVHRSTEASDKSLLIRSPQKTPLKVLELTGVMELLDVEVSDADN